MVQILGFLGLGKIQLAVAVAASAIIGLLWFQNSTLQDDKQQLTENNARLSDAVEIQRDTIIAQRDAIGEWKAHARQLAADMEDLQETSRQASKELVRLDDIFADHDLTKLSLQKPGLIEKRLNTGTADALRMLERSTSGSAED